MNEAPVHIRHGNLTYAGLKDRLNSLTQDQLNQTVTVFVPGVDEFFGIKSLETASDSDILDEGHFYLKI